MTAPNINLQAPETRYPGTPGAVQKPRIPLGQGMVPGGYPGSATPTAMPQMQSAPAQPQTQTFGTGNNLIGTQINPTDSARTGQAAGMTTGAAQTFAATPTPQWSGVGAQNTAPTMQTLGQGLAKTQATTANPYTAVAGTNLSGAQGQWNAANAATNSAAANPYTAQGQTGGFGYNGDTAQARRMTLDQLSKTLNAPDRGAIAQSTFDRLTADTNPAFQKELRATTAANAALGRRGSGLMTSNLADVQSERNRFLASQAGQLADNAASQSLQDRINQVQAAQGVAQGFGGMDTAAGSLNLGYQNANNQERGAAFDRTRALGTDTFNQRMALGDASARYGQIARNDALQERDAQRQATLDQNTVLTQQGNDLRQYGMDQYGIGRDQYGDQVAERDKGFNAGQQAFNNAASRLNTLSGYEGFTRANDRQAQQDLRGERDYQYGLSRDAQQARIQQNQQQENQFGNNWDRYASMLNTGYGAGSQYANALNGQAERLGQQGADAMSAGSQLLGMLGQQRGAQGAGDLSSSEMMNILAPNGVNNAGIRDMTPSGQMPPRPRANFDPSVIASLLGGN